MQRTTLSLVIALALASATMNAATVSKSYKGKIYERTGIYEYAPTAIAVNGNIECWFCAGDWIGTNAYNDNIHRASGPYVPGDPLRYSWSSSKRVLCPSSPGPDGNPTEDLCANDYPSGPDKVNVCDPSVVKVNGTYYMYYTAGTFDAAGNSANGIFLATSTDGINWVKYPSVYQEPIPLITAPHNNRLGAGQASVVYKDGDVLPLLLSPRLVLTKLGLPADLNESDIVFGPAGNFNVQRK